MIRIPQTATDKEYAEAIGAELANILIKTGLRDDIVKAEIYISDNAAHISVSAVRRSEVGKGKAVGPFREGD